MNITCTLTEMTLKLFSRIPWPQIHIQLSLLPTYRVPLKLAYHVSIPVPGIETYCEFGNTGLNVLSS